MGFGLSALMGSANPASAQAHPCFFSTNTKKQKTKNKKQKTKNKKTKNNNAMPAKLVTKASSMHWRE
jgi:hypothetical protein